VKKLGEVSSREEDSEAESRHTSTMCNPSRRYRGPRQGQCSLGTPACPTGWGCTRPSSNRWPPCKNGRRCDIHHRSSSGRWHRRCCRCSTRRLSCTARQRSCIRACRRNGARPRGCSGTRPSSNPRWIGSARPCESSRPRPGNGHRPHTRPSSNLCHRGSARPSPCSRGAPCTWQDRRASAGTGPRNSRWRCCTFPRSRGSLAEEHTTRRPLRRRHTGPSSIPERWRRFLRPPGTRAWGRRTCRRHIRRSSNRCRPCTSLWLGRNGRPRTCRWHSRGHSRRRPDCTSDPRWRTPWSMRM
jgi:hypothetical protein